MPSHPIHIAVGTAVAAVSFAVISYFKIIPVNLTGLEWIILAVVVFVYSQLADIDSPASKVNKLWNTVAGMVGISILVLEKYAWIGVVAVSSIVALEWVKHRGFTHDAWFAVAISAPLWLIHPIIAVLGFGAYISHLIADGEFGRLGR